MAQKGLFDQQEREAKLEKQSQTLIELKSLIPWEQLAQPIAARRQPSAKGGRPFYPAVLVLKILVLQQLYNLSDEQTEYQINDRLSFMRFLDLDLSQPVPDAKTIWSWRESLSKAGIFDQLFDHLNAHITSAGYRATTGQIVDASLIRAPIQRNTRNENNAIKEGKTPEDWREKPHKFSQKDTDARWTKKHGKGHYGYKNHLNIDSKHGFIRRSHSTPANVADNTCFDTILDTDNNGQYVYADSAYRNQEIKDTLAFWRYKNRINHRAYANKPLSAAKHASNHRWSKIRSKVEHVFAGISQQGGKFIRVIGLRRANSKIQMMNVVYNLRRLAFHERIA